MAFTPNQDANYVELVIGNTVDAGIIYEKVQLKNTDPTDESFFSELNELIYALHDDAGLGRQDYDRAIYLKGDFTESHSAALAQKKQSSSLKYNLYRNNCVINSMKMIEATIDEFVAKLNTYVLSHHGTPPMGLASLIGSIIPNYVHSMMEGFLKK